MKYYPQDKIREKRYIPKKNAKPKKTKSDDGREHYFKGLLGAFLASCVSAGAWYLFYQMGFISGAVGAIASMAAISMYKSFGNRLSLKGALSALVICVIMIAAVWYPCAVNSVHDLFREQYHLGKIEIDQWPSINECYRNGFTYMVREKVLDTHLVHLGIGILSCLLGAAGGIGSLYDAEKKRRENVALQNEGASSAKHTKDTDADE